MRAPKIVQSLFFVLASIIASQGCTTPPAEGMCAGGCPAGQSCVVAPGCSGETSYRCAPNTCNDAALLSFCGCDGQSFTRGGCAPSNQRYAHAGVCGDSAFFDATPSDAPVSDAPMIDAPMIDAPMNDAPVTDGCGGRCAGGTYCAVAPGCDGAPTYQCAPNTCMDASLVLFCGCDGQSFSNPEGACTPRTRRYRATGPCVDAGVSVDASSGG
jgi:hypothetical protein